jgi:hypothetical protein
MSHGQKHKAEPVTPTLPMQNLKLLRTTPECGEFVNGVFVHSGGPSAWPGAEAASTPSHPGRGQKARSGPAPEELADRATEEIWIRDPFVTVAPACKGKPARYVMFGTTDRPPPGVGPYSAYAATGFACYTAASLSGPWNGPHVAFSAGVRCPTASSAHGRAQPHFWATTQFWAPEVTMFAGHWCAAWRCCQRTDPAPGAGTSRPRSASWAARAGASRC